MRLSWPPTDVQQVNQMREVFIQNSSQSQEPELTQEFQQPQYGVSTIRDLALKLTICRPFQKRTGKR
jgi:hypothetical protein